MKPHDSPAETPPDSAPTRRLFLAIPLPEDLRQAIADLSHRLQTGARFTALRATWVPTHNYHMTLHFLGSVDDERATRLEAGLRSLEGNLPSFPLAFRGLGYFPHERAPRVLWLGVPKPPPQLDSVVGATETAIRHAGIAVQHQNFHAHITLARFKALKGTAAFVNIARNYADAAPGRFEVDRLVLMQSVLSKGAPEYREVMGIRLKWEE
jgi:RNA 2',3'-cyclic 3'-phosphodiesterase